MNKNQCSFDLRDFQWFSHGLHHVLPWLILWGSPGWIAPGPPHRLGEARRPGRQGQVSGRRGLARRGGHSLGRHGQPLLQRAPWPNGGDRWRRSWGHGKIHGALGTTSRTYGEIMKYETSDKMLYNIGIRLSARWRIFFNRIHSATRRVTGPATQPLSHSLKSPVAEWLSSWCSQSGRVSAWCYFEVLGVGGGGLGGGDGWVAEWLVQPLW